MKLVFVLVTVFLLSYMIVSTKGQTKPPKLTTTKPTKCPFVQPTSFVNNNNEDEDGFSISKSSESIESTDDGYTISKSSKSVESIDDGYSTRKSSESLESIYDEYSTRKSSESVESIQSRAPGDNCPVDDGFPCTNDCMIDVTCYHEPKHILCDDTFACTIDQCIQNKITKAYECIHTARITPNVCEDNNVCTPTDSCSLKDGCVHTLTTCATGQPCTISNCDKTTGTCSAPIAANSLCNDNDPCTTDICDPGTGDCSHGDACADTDPCTMDICEPGTGACSHPPDTSAPGC